VSVGGRGPGVRSDFFVQLYPTLRCNLACGFCFNRGLPPLPDVDPAAFARMLDNLAAAGVATLDLLGGEPTLHPRLGELIAALAARGMRTTLSTNGRGDLALLERLEERFGRGTLRVGVSVNEGEAPADGREARADRAAAAVAGADALASALVKVHVFAPAWEAVVDAMVYAVRSRTQYVNASALFQEIVASNADPERLKGLGPQEQGHPTDRHPPLAHRLEALSVDRERLAAASLVTSPTSPAIALVEDAETIEQGLSAAEQRLIAETS